MLDRGFFIALLTKRKSKDMSTKPIPKVMPVFEGLSYNRLDGEARQWAKDNRIPRSEFCVPVNGGKRFGGPDWAKMKCGNGRMGFTTRRRRQDKVRIEVGLDGQFKASRKTLVNRRSLRCLASHQTRRIDGSRCGLVSNTQLQQVSRDPLKIAAQKEIQKKHKRSRNRNHRARRGHKQKIRNI